MNTPAPLPAQQLFTCPRCNRRGFYSRGLLAHVCRGNGITDRRRRLTTQELRTSMGRDAETGEITMAKQGGAK